MGRGPPHSAVPVHHVTGLRDPAGGRPVSACSACPSAERLRVQPPMRRHPTVTNHIGHQRRQHQVGTFKRENNVRPAPADRFDRPNLPDVIGTTPNLLRKSLRNLLPLAYLPGSGGGMKSSLRLCAQDKLYAGRCHQDYSKSGSSRTFHRVAISPLRRCRRPRRARSRPACVPRSRAQLLNNIRGACEGVAMLNQKPQSGAGFAEPARAHQHRGPLISGRAE